MKFYNTLTGKKEEFEPIDKNNVRIYACGPTVYDRPHLGNARSAVVYDLLFRTLRAVYGENHVTYIKNITDVDDKINKASKDRGISIQKLTSEMTDYYRSDMKAIGNLTPTFEPKATENIPEIIGIIQKLIDNGHAYVSEGHVLFDVSSDKEYGKLSGRSVEDMLAGARIEIASYKKDPMDFVLWKPASENDDASSIFDSPWGRGRPGWHIECSAMSHRYLGDTFDIHGGGADLKFPHHENEIAQSTCAFHNSQYAKFWMHNGFLTVDGEKMSKSLGNFTTVKELLDEGYEGIVIRFVLMQNHYRKPLDFTRESLQEARKALYHFHQTLDKDTLNNKVPSEAIDDLSDDLNTPKVIAYLHESSSKSIPNLAPTLKFLGLYDENFVNNVDKKLKEEKNDLSGLNITKEEIEKQISLRNDAKANKDWAKADAVRNELLNKNIKLIDKADGITNWEVIR